MCIICQSENLHAVAFFALLLLSKNLWRVELCSIWGFGYFCFHFWVVSYAVWLVGGVVYFCLLPLDILYWCIHCACFIVNTFYLVKFLTTAITTD